MYSEQLVEFRPGDQPCLLVDLQGSDTEPARMVVFGEVDAVSADRLQQAVVDVLRRRRPRGLEMDFHGVTFLDSVGIRALLLCHADARRVDCQIRLTNPHPMVYHVLQITGLLEHFGLTAPPPSTGRNETAAAAPR
jgi:anti-anti-sigma factor